MYPAQTSFIPVHIALARFLGNQGPSASSGLYPYWYLGSTPFRYLTGPILPSLLVFFHKLLPAFNLFEIFFGILGVIFSFGAVGVYLLVKTLMSADGNAEKRGSVAFLAAIFYFLGPVMPLLFPFSDGLDLLAFSFLPYVLFVYAKFLRRERHKSKVLLCLLIAFVILLDSSIIPTMVLGMAAIFLATTGWKKAEEKLKKSFLIFAFSFLISSIWYTPGYWWQVFLAPSFAGKPFYKVVSELAQLLPISLAVGLAIVSGKIIKSKDRVLKFCFYWLFIFGFLTFIRFISDPDFWMDWTAYGLELQLGVGLMMAWLVSRLKTGLREAMAGGLVVMLATSWLFLISKNVIGTLQKDITKSVEYKIGQFLSETVKPGERVFLSGSSVFWLNAFFDIVQVRGGVDQAAVHPTWDKAAWEIREGKNAEDAEEWLRTLNVSYLVVHSSASSEYYHDFVYPEKFEDTTRLKKIYDDQGDRIYRRH